MAYQAYFEAKDCVGDSFSGVGGDSYMVSSDEEAESKIKEEDNDTFVGNIASDGERKNTVCSLNIYIIGFITVIFTSFLFYIVMWWHIICKGSDGDLFYEMFTP